MVQIGNDITPGPITTVTTANFVGRHPESPQNVVLLGSADLGAGVDQGSGDAGTVYNIISAPQARDTFGADSNLTASVKLALGNGSKPVMAAAAEQVGVTDEAIDAQSGTLANAPLPEKTSAVTFTLAGTDQETELVYDLDSAGVPADGTAYVNPTDGSYQLADSFDGTLTNTASYSYNDYTTALDNVELNVGGVVDFLAVTQENEELVAEAEIVANSLEAQYDFCIALGSPATTITDIGQYTNPFNNSRVQLYYNTRELDGTPAMGAIAGKRGQLSLSTSPMRKGLSGVTRMLHRLDDTQISNLLDAKINPIESRTQGATIGDDLTSIADDNSDEAGMDSGFTRMVMDQVTLVTVENEDPFIGALNLEETRNNLEGVLETQLDTMEDSNEIQDFVVSVEPRDARSADVRVSAETTKALRNIYNTVTAGINENEAEA